MALLERDSALAALAEYGEQARSGYGRLVLVAGEAGAGKSALLEEFERQLPDATWSWGGCDGLSTPRPLGPLFDLAGDLGGEVLELCRAGADRDQLFDALLRRIDRPGELTVVAVEDVHWADDATLDLLRFLGRRLRTVSALVLVTYRDDQLGTTDPLRLALGELATHRSTRRLALPPLTEQAVGELAAGSGLEPAELFRLTGGNPFYVTEVISGGTSEVPASARDAVLARVGRLGDSARTVLDAAALFRTRLDLPVLQATVACAEPALDELLDSGLLVGDGQGLRFRHELARLAVEQLVPAHRRAGTHARILAALCATGSVDDARLAFHAEAAGDVPAVLRHATAAGRRAAGFGSHREAAAQYARALRFAADAPPAEVASLYAGLAEHASLLDRFQDAAGACEQALLLWRELGDRLREGATTRRLAMALASLCRGAEAVDAGEAAVAILEPLGPTVELARAYGTLGALRMVAGDGPGAVGLSHRAAALAEQFGAYDVLADALDTEACAREDAGADWVELLVRALDLAVEHGLRPQAGRAYANLSGGLSDQRRFVEADVYFQAGMDYCEEHDLGTYVRCLLACRTTVQQHRGQWDEALAVSLRLLEGTETSPQNRICPNTWIGSTRARRGEPDVWPCLDEAMAGADGTGEPQYVVPVRLIRAETHWLAGDLAAARHEAELAADSAGAADRWLRGETAVWLRRTGSTRVVDGPVAEPYVLQLAGEWRAAADAWLALDCRFDAAMALVDSSDDAELREALALLDALGAVATARVVRRTMRRLGMRSVPAGPRQATRSHPLGLTRREREVLELLVTGSSNAEIAAALVISTRTVDHHVSAVLAKLGTPTRAEASAEATRRGLVGTSA
jgi:DNA-binding CsgD family transcriptional regulator/tetratricopeptide (TPR) repeat protein